MTGALGSVKSQKKKTFIHFRHYIEIQPARPNNTPLYAGRTQYLIWDNFRKSRVHIINTQRWYILEAVNLVSV